MSAQYPITATSLLEEADLYEEVTRAAMFFRDLGMWPTNDADLLTIYRAIKDEDVSALNR